MEPKPTVHNLGILLMNNNRFAIYFQQHSSYVFQISIRKSSFQIICKYGMYIQTSMKQDLPRPLKNGPHFLK